MIGTSYALATGVTLNAFGVYAEAEDDTPSPSDKEEGYIIGTGIKINF